MNKILWKAVSKKERFRKKKCFGIGVSGVSFLLVFFHLQSWLTNISRNLLLFLFYPEKCLMDQWSTKKAKKNFRVFFLSYSNKKKTILLVFFWGAKTCQKSCKLGQHQKVKRKASVFFIQSITKKKTSIESILPA